MRRNLSEHDARRLLVCGPLVLVTTTWRNSEDVMPAAWSMPLSADPPFIGVAVHPSRHTHDMIRFSEEFALNIPGRRLLNHCQYFGTTSGRDLDKLELSKLPTFHARKVGAKLLEGCVAYIECGVEDALRIGDHTLFVGRVVAVSADEEAYNELWTLADEDEKPLHYLGGDWYAMLGTRLQARPPASAGPGEESDEDRERRELERERDAEERERMN
ncbi:MAG TPA: flavin reductase family protein [Dehalococcoidia bacterium]|nr:flavin reductase family protein [Dehalococcoidia bacterium]